MPNYTLAIENISSNIFLSDLSSEFQNDLHYFSSNELTILNERIVPPV